MWPPQSVVVHPSPPDPGIHPSAPPVEIKVIPTVGGPGYVPVTRFGHFMPIELIITAASAAVIVAWHLQRARLGRFITS
jgi:hypothetical protein